MLDQKEGLESRSTSAVDSASEIRVGREHLFHALPPHESYEGHHRWDPAFEWDEAEERRLVRKTDLFLLSWLCVMFFGLQLDRGNLSNALTDGLLKDLKITSNDYVSFSPFRPSLSRLQYTDSTRTTARRSNFSLSSRQSSQCSSSPNATASAGSCPS